MTDIRVVQTISDFDISLDWLLRADGSLDDSDDLATAVIVALGTDRRADAADELPNPDDTDRRGWWGDMEAEEIWGGWPIGSRLWLLHRAKITDIGARDGALVARVEAYLHEAMQPFIDNSIASSVTISATRNGLGRIDGLVTLHRDQSRSLSLRFDSLWG
jgi:phage gp46-like protein